VVLSAVTFAFPAPVELHEGLHLQYCCCRIAAIHKPYSFASRILVRSVVSVGRLQILSERICRLRIVIQNISLSGWSCSVFSAHFHLLFICWSGRECQVLGFLSFNLPHFWMSTSSLDSVCAQPVCISIWFGLRGFSRLEEVLPSHVMDKLSTPFLELGRDQASLP
jgi:hypothetical protein